MVWDVIAYYTRSSLELIRGTMTAQWYAHDILQPHVLQDVTRLSPHCYYPSLACPIPKFVSNRAYLGSCGMAVGYPTSLNELEARLQQIWSEMSQESIQNLYATMPDRIASCIRARGCSTGY
ncbi:uncharacterized protein TNCV_2422741 [Trichonephila clavipes]|nr:uncharacterized protein TNCV_2422741 [Trichonephila clavipes]